MWKWPGREERALARSARRQQEPSDQARRYRLIENIERQLEKRKAYFDKSGWPQTDRVNRWSLTRIISLPFEMYYPAGGRPGQFQLALTGKLHLYDPWSRKCVRAKLFEMSTSALRYLECDLLSMNGPA